MGKIKVNLEFFLNLCFYSLYRLFGFFSRCFLKINPLRLLGELPYYKRKFKERGIDINNQYNDYLTNKVYGLDRNYSSAAFSVGLISFLVVILIHLNYLLKLKMTVPKLIFTIAIAVFIAQYFVLWRDKYLKYFEKFEKQRILEKRFYLWMLLTFVCMILFPILVILSFPFIL